MRRIMLALIVVALLVVSFAPAAFGHVHGVTPLLQCTVDNANSGGLGTNGTPAAFPDGPLAEFLIPSPLTFREGGFGATDGNCP